MTSYVHDVQIPKKIKEIFQYASYNNTCDKEVNDVHYLHCIHMIKVCQYLCQEHMLTFVIHITNN